MKTLECKSNSDRYALTVGNKYEILSVESDGSFVVVVNDKGTEARYSASLFEREEKYPKSPKEGKLVWDLALTNSQDSTWEVTFKNKGTTLQFFIDGTSISCGLMYLNGLNPLLDFVETFYDRGQLDQKAVTFKDILRSVLLKEQEENGIAAFVIVSPAVSLDIEDGYGERLAAIIDRVIETTPSITSSPWKINPNSGNSIRVMAIDYIAFLEV